MLATNKTPLLDQQDSSKQFLFDLIKVVYEVIQEKQNSIPQVYTIPEVAEILKCKTKTMPHTGLRQSVVGFTIEKVVFESQD